MVGVGRDNDENSGGGTELYVIIGHSPRNLDRQLTMLGRVVQGMEIMSSFPRGTGDIGFYKTPARNTSAMPTSRSPRTCPPDTAHPTRNHEDRQRKLRYAGELAPLAEG